MIANGIGLAALYVGVAFAFLMLDRLLASRATAAEAPPPRVA